MNDLPSITFHIFSLICVCSQFTLQSTRLTEQQSMQLQQKGQLDSLHQELRQAEESICQTKLVHAASLQDLQLLQMEAALASEDLEATKARLVLSAAEEGAGQERVQKMYQQLDRCLWNTTRVS